jgi:hypothetical protein
MARSRSHQPRLGINRGADHIATPDGSVAIGT